MGGSGMSAQGSRSKACRKLRELAGRTTTTTCVKRRRHVNFQGTAVYDSRNNGLCSYVYIPFPAARGEGRKKDYSHTQKQQTSVALHLFFLPF